jgi:hypothetical protein
VDLSSEPLTGGVFHLPNVTVDNATKTLTITTYTQASWSLLDAFDTGFDYTSAVELATKQLSRQCTFIKGAGVNVSFSVDDPSFCMQTNQEAYQWALQNAGVTTRNRYIDYGQQYQFALDVQELGGPWWIDAQLSFNSTVDQYNNSVMVVSAPACKTDINYWNETFPWLPRPSFIPDPGETPCAAAACRRSLSVCLCLCL